MRSKNSFSEEDALLDEESVSLLESSSRAFASASTSIKKSRSLLICCLFLMQGIFKEETLNTHKTFCEVLEKHEGRPKCISTLRLQGGLSKLI